MIRRRTFVGRNGDRDAVWSYGAGASAPAWSGKTIYTAEDFSVDLPTSSANAAGFRGFQGFTDADYLRASYPTISTPFGSKPVLRITYPGQTETFTTDGQTTTPWKYKSTEYYNAGVRVTGSWSGTLLFEQSPDGVSSWAAAPDVTNAGTPVTETTVNGTFKANASTTSVYLRVRGSGFSGTATISVGMYGGQAPARFTAGDFSAGQGKIYTRVVYRVSSDFAMNGNTGTKFFFFSKVSPNNHYVNLVDSTPEIKPTIALQGHGNESAQASFTSPIGAWTELEFLAEANVPGDYDGLGQTYLNGVLCADKSDFDFFQLGATAEFVSFFCDPTYGGGLNPPPANIYLDIAYWYRESAA